MVNNPELREGLNLPTPRDANEESLFFELNSQHSEITKAINSLEVETNTDEKVKASSGDATADYLDGKVDDSTIEVVSDNLQVKDAGIVEAKLGTGAVVEAKLGTGAVTADKIGTDAVTTIKIINDAVTTAKIADANVTKAKIENVADMRVLGNVSGSPAAPAEVTIIDDDTMATASATNIPSSESIKAYFDNNQNTIEYVAGDILVEEAPTERTEGTTTFTKKKEIRIAFGGELRIKFEIKNLNNNGGRHAECYIYRNGSQVGTLRQNDTNSYVEFSEDVSGWSAGDLCQAYLRMSNTAGGEIAHIKNFELYADPNYLTTVLTD